MNYHSLSDLTRKHKAGQSLGIYSVCSANPFVIKASLTQAKADDSLLLVEATSNQVDQFGGYTGMKPVDYIQFIRSIAAEVKFPSDHIIFGGDHLGPNAWQDQTAEKAMENARVLVSEYVKAGFGKIHLDTSMRCADDPAGALDPDIVAARAANLCEVAEQSIPENQSMAPVYVVGTEVPVPGGAHEELDELVPTSVDDLSETIAVHKDLFLKKNLESAWDRVIAVVVQPGVEFGSDSIVEYDPQKAQALVKHIEGYDSLLYEAHSTDYQLPSGLRQLVVDHFAILKVGPQLTFALREAILALEQIESEMLPLNRAWQPSDIRSTLISTMRSEPRYWKNHYSEETSKHLYEFLFSLSDRIRYYWPMEAIQNSLDQLIQNLSASKIPLPLLSQYMPLEYELVREGRLKNDPISMMQGKVQQVLLNYSRACGIDKPTAGVY